jgi:hypothetical protein
MAGGGVLETTPVTPVEAKVERAFHAKAQSSQRFFPVFFASSASLREKIGT